MCTVIEIRTHSPFGYDVIYRLEEHIRNISDEKTLIDKSRVALDDAFRVAGLKLMSIVDDER